MKVEHKARDCPKRETVNEERDTARQGVMTITPVNELKNE